MNDIFFVDTVGWLAIVNDSDSLHKKASEIYLKKVAAGWNVLTHQAVLLEVGNGLSSRKQRHLAVELVEKLKAAMHVEIIQVDEDFYEAGWNLYSARPDKDWGIVDCISFVLMKREGIIEALTADHHFEQAGFIKLL